MDTTNITIITAIATIMLTMLTGVYVVLTNRLLRSSQRPYVVVSIQSIDLTLFLKIENKGRIAAKNVVIKFSPEIDGRMLHPEIGIESIRKLMSQSSLVPDQAISTVLNINTDIFNHKESETFPRSYEVSISYYAANKKHFPYLESYTINLGNYFFRKKTAQFSSENRMERIAKALEEIATSIKK